MWPFILSETGTADNPIRYAGYQYDVESDLHYLNARYYDSKIARFITEDTYRGQKDDPLSLNLYTYCANNPIVYVDPSGHYNLKAIDVFNITMLAIQVLSINVMELDTGYIEYNKSSEQKYQSTETYVAGFDIRKLELYKPTDNLKGTGKAGDKNNITSTAEFKDTYGGLMIEMGNKLGVDPNLLSAVILVESSGSGFVDGKLKVRFENHKFVARAGYSDLFAYNSSQKWKGHKWRNSTSDEWNTVHTGKQKDEYVAFKFALTLDENAAYESISMGMGQIMGFNYADVGYNSAKEMYDDFSTGNEAQISGMVTFISNYNNGKALQALQDGNLESFISQYNGSGMVDTYKKLMLQSMEEYKKAK